MILVDILHWQYVKWMKWKVDVIAYQMKPCDDMSVYRLIEKRDENNANRWGITSCYYWIVHLLLKHKKRISCFHFRTMSCWIKHALVIIRCCKVVNRCVRFTLWGQLMLLMYKGKKCVKEEEKERVKEWKRERGKNKDWIDGPLRSPLYLFLSHRWFLVTPFLAFGGSIIAAAPFVLQFFTQKGQFLVFDAGFFPMLCI